MTDTFLPTPTAIPSGTHLFSCLGPQVPPRLYSFSPVTDTFREIAITDEIATWVDWVLDNARTTATRVGGIASITCLETETRSAPRCRTYGTFVNAPLIAVQQLYSQLYVVHPEPILTIQDTAESIPCMPWAVEGPFSQTDPTRAYTRQWALGRGDRWFFWYDARSYGVGQRLSPHAGALTGYRAVE